MVVLDVLVDGWRRVAASPWLLPVVWASHALIAATAAIPVWTWLASATACVPEADGLRTRFLVGVFSELTQYDRSSVPSVLLSAAAGSVLLGFFVGPLLFGGTLEILASRDDRPFLHRFFRGGGRFYGRLLRATVLGWIAALAAAGAITIAVTLALRPALTRGADPDAFLGLAPAAAGGLALVVGIAVLDLTRIQLVRRDERRVAGTWWASVRFAALRAVPVAAIWMVSGVVLAFLTLTYLVVTSRVPADTWPLIGLSVVLQQALIVGRTAVRLAVVAAEYSLAERADPQELAATPE